MGLTFSASLNENGNPQIYGSNTFQASSGDPIVDIPLIHRLVIERDASSILISVTPVDTAKTVDDSATASYYHNVTSLSFMTSGGLDTSNYDGANHRFELSGAFIFSNIYNVPFRFVFTDSTYEDHIVYITRNNTAFDIEQTAGTNTVSLEYINPGQVQSPIDDWGVSYNNDIKYEYQLPDSSDWIEFAAGDIQDEYSKEFDNAYVGLKLRATRTAYDENNTLIFQSIGDIVVFDMTDATPSLSLALSDLYCGCTSIDVTDSTTYQNRQNWWLGIFTRNIVDSTPYYKGAEIGNYKNPVRDSSWAINIPFNGSYTFKAILIRKYDEANDYSAGDWIFNPIDNELYVSVLDSNIGNSLDNLVYWRKWNKITDLETVFSKTSNTVSDTFLYQVLSKSITCNDSAPVNIKTGKSCLSSCSTLIIDDTTGEFDFETNPHGYGAPHYYRYEYANLYFLVNKRSDGTVAYTPATYNYLSAESIVFDLKKDGIYKLRMFQVAIYDTDPTKRYYLNDSVFDEATNLFYASKVNNNTYPLTNTDAWKAVSKIEEFEALNNFGNWEWYYPITCNGYKTLNDIGLGLTNDICAASCKDVLFKKYDLIDVYLRGARNAFDVYDYDTAQCLLEAVPINCAPYMGGKGGCGC